MNANYIPEESTQRSEFQHQGGELALPQKYNSRAGVQDQRKKRSVSPQNFERTLPAHHLMQRLSQSEFLEEEDDIRSNLIEHHSHINHQSFGQYDFST